MFVMVSVFVACHGDRMDLTMSVADKNGIELQRLIEHYEKDNAERTKLEAALFLVENMVTHHSLTSPAIDSFTYRLKATDILKTDSLNTWWKELSKGDKTECRYDARTLTANFLKDNIDRAVDTWRKSPWHDEVDQALFLRYVLPYRLCDEPLAQIGWRDSLYQKYHPLIVGETDLKRAYAKVFKAVQKEIRLSEAVEFPYLLNVLDAGRMGRGRCINRCVYTAMVMRALGIPVVVDGTNRWANYSRQGHSWVALLLGDGTYTIAKGDSLPRKHNPIDASEFTLKYPVENDFPISLDFKKRAASVWRSEYVYHVDDFDDKLADDETRQLFLYPYHHDVSTLYGIDHTVKLKAKTPDEHCYLCTFATGDDWKPVNYARRNWSGYVFEVVADSVVYLPMSFNEEKKLVPAGNPFFVTRNGLKNIIPNKKKTIQMTLTRKYPFACNIVTTWVETIGAHFEGSNRPDFKDADTLYLITHTPLYRNTVNISSPKKYRYLRYVSPPQHRGPVTEIMYFSNGKLLQGMPFATGGINPGKCFDGNTSSFMDKLEIGYTIGLDLGRRVKVDSLEFFLKNDGNYIADGDDYELFYYDNSWISLGIQKGKDHSLTYGKVPSGALLLLRNNSRGREERIFTYEQWRQVWW